MQWESITGFDVVSLLVAGGSKPNVRFVAGFARGTIGFAVLVTISLLVLPMEGFVLPGRLVLCLCWIS